MLDEEARELLRGGERVAVRELDATDLGEGGGGVVRTMSGDVGRAGGSASAMGSCCAGTCTVRAS